MRIKILIFLMLFSCLSCANTVIKRQVQVITQYVGTTAVQSANIKTFGHTPAPAAGITALDYYLDDVFSFVMSYYNDLNFPTYAAGSDYITQTTTPTPTIAAADVKQVHITSDDGATFSTAANTSSTIGVTDLDGGASTTIISASKRYARLKDFRVQYKETKPKRPYFIYDFSADCYGATSLNLHPELTFKVKFFKTDADAKALYDKAFQDADGAGPNKDVGIAWVNYAGVCTDKITAAAIHTGTGPAVFGMASDVTLCQLLQGTYANANVCVNKPT